MARELIDKDEFDALTDLYLSHPENCPCQTCRRVDELINKMCIEAGCRNESAPGLWGCQDHPHHAPR